MNVRRRKTRFDGLDLPSFFALNQVEYSTIRFSPVSSAVILPYNSDDFSFVALRECAPALTCLVEVGLTIAQVEVVIESYASGRLRGFNAHDDLDGCSSYMSAAIYHCPGLGSSPALVLKADEKIQSDGLKHTLRQQRFRRRGQEVIASTLYINARWPSTKLGRSSVSTVSDVPNTSSPHLIYFRNKLKR